MGTVKAVLAACLLACTRAQQDHFLSFVREEEQVCHADCLRPDNPAYRREHEQAGNKDELSAVRSVCQSAGSPRAGTVCIYGMCCAANDAGSRCSSDEKGNIHQRAQLAAKLAQMDTEARPSCGDYGRCMRRRKGVDHHGQFHGDGHGVSGDVSLGSAQDGVPAYGINSTAVGPQEEWVRYCLCSPGFYGATCALQMDPYGMFRYGAISLVVSTLFMFILFAARGTHVGDCIDIMQYANRFLLHVPPRTAQPLDATAQDARLLAAAVTIGFFEQLIMIAGALSRSVPWSRDFFFVELLQELFLNLLDLFSTLSDWVLPDSWNSKNTFQIQVLMVAPVPLYVVSQYFKKANATDDERAEQALGNNMLPLFVLPIAGCLFKPIVGCNMLDPGMAPRLRATQDMSHQRPPPDEELFAPPSEVKLCSYGQATEDYVLLGEISFLPFWIIAMYFNTLPQPADWVFAKSQGYRAWHTQLQICCAMVWRAFAHYHPRLLTFSLTIMNAAELLLVWRWQPSRLQMCNELRLQAAWLAMIWGGSACVAAAVRRLGTARTHARTHARTPHAATALQYPLPTCTQPRPSRGCRLTH
jgi:hypothetical protein